MGYAVKQQDNEIAYNVKKFICDTEADVAAVPTNTCAPGSTLFCIETCKGYMLNTDLEWKEIF